MARGSGQRLRRIAPEAVRSGMFVHGFDGSWLAHPFWRSRFLLVSADDVAKVRDAGMPVVIDLERGCDVDAEEVLPCAAPPPAAGSRDGVARDRAAARQTVDRAKRAMRGVFDGARLGRAIRSAEVVAVVDDISRALDRNAQMLIDMTRLKTKDEYTYLHSVAVCALMVMLARDIGLPDEEARRMGIAGLLHDVGKMTIDDAILMKPGRLTDAEFAEIRLHTDRGHAMLAACADTPDVALDVCLHHHERMDGTGYPHRLPGAEISLAARMGAICDVYDALTSERPYKEPRAPVAAITAMDGWEGHFDRALMFRFMRSIGVYPVGTLVRIRSNRLAIALDNGRRATRPRFRTFHCAVSGENLAFEDIVISGDQVVARAYPEGWGFEDWDAMRARILAGRSLQDRRAARATA